MFFLLVYIGDIFRHFFIPFANPNCYISFFKVPMKFNNRWNELWVVIFANNMKWLFFGSLQVVMLLSCVMAFLLNYTVFLNTTLNSALTQSICGNLKVWRESTFGNLFIDLRSRPEIKKVHFGENWNCFSIWKTCHMMIQDNFSCRTCLQLDLVGCSLVDFRLIWWASTSISTFFLHIFTFLIHHIKNSQHLIFYDNDFDSISVKHCGSISWFLGIWPVRIL